MYLECGTSAVVECLHLKVPHHQPSFRVLDHSYATWPAIEEAVTDFLHDVRVVHDECDWILIGFDVRWGFDDEEGDGNWMCIMISIGYGAVHADLQHWETV